MRIPGFKTCRQFIRWLRSRFNKRALILGYHRIADVPSDVYRTCVSPKNFATHLEILHQYTNPVSLCELVQALLNKNLPPRTVALTIDDGYADVLYQAKPLLERYEIPTTTFVATGYLGSEFWWDKLERIIFAPKALPKSLSLVVNGHIHKWTSVEPDSAMGEKGTNGSRHRLLQSLYHLLLPLDARLRQPALAQLEAWAGVTLDTNPHCRSLTSDEIVELAKGDLIDIGAHTVTHPVLPAIPEEMQRVEIQESKLCLEQILDRPVHSFSYPNGSTSEDTLIIVRNSGFVCACTSDSDVARVGSDLFQLPRYWVRNWPGSEFSKKIQMWL